MLASHMGDCIWADSFSIDLAVNRLGKAVDKAQVLVSLLSTYQTWKKLPATTFSMAQPWQLQSSRE